MKIQVEIIETLNKQYKIRYRWVRFWGLWRSKWSLYHNPGIFSSIPMTFTEYMKALEVANEIKTTHGQYKRTTRI